VDLSTTARASAASLARPRREHAQRLPQLTSIREGLAAIGAAYAHLLLSRSPVVGVLLMTATSLVPRMFVAGLLSVAVMHGATRILGLRHDLLRSSSFSYNALLVGLGIAAHAEPTVSTLVLGIAALSLCLFLTTFLYGWLELKHAIPVLTWPFLGAMYVVLGTLPWLGVPAPSHEASTLLANSVPPLARAYLETLGALLFLPRVDVGLIVLAALWSASRISSLLSLLGFLLAHELGTHLLVWGDPHLSTSLNLNAVLIAIALGGHWFVPSRSSFLLAALGSLLTAVCGLSLWERFSSYGTPLLILPFNATLPLLLVCMRARARDGSPKSVDFMPGTPEQNLQYYRTKQARFGAVQGVRFALPFRGSWTCTQGVLGRHTHQGAFQHALDFEVKDQEGRSYRGEGRTPAEYFCYRLPVLAPAAGTVVKVVDHLPDNEIGESDLTHSWGNAVILHHGPGLYSCVCHLAPGTITVREGQYVPLGEVLGLSGSSGRSPVPHLHFQLQATPELGAHTIPIELHDIVLTSEAAPRICSRAVPQEGQCVRNLEADVDKDKLLRFTQESARNLAVVDADGRRKEQVVARVDFSGRTLLWAETSKSALYYTHTPTMFTVHDVTGKSAALHALRFALSRVAFDAAEDVLYTDALPLRPFLPWWTHAAFDLLAPFFGRASLDVQYRVRRRGRALIVEGQSLRKSRKRGPVLTTSAVLLDPSGVLSVEVNLRGTRTHIQVSPPARRGEANSIRGEVS